LIPAPPEPSIISWKSEIIAWRLRRTAEPQRSYAHHQPSINLAEPQPEVKDHASEHPEIVRELTALHEAWANEVELKSTGGYRIQK
jgi:hypothetical protein